MSSLPKQHTPIPSSKQPVLRPATAVTASSRPRPISQLSGSHAGYTQGDATDEPAPEALGQVEGGPSQLPSASTFKPFFTLIEDANSADHHHHPTVHYIFSDDDTELITEASLRVLETGPVSPPQNPPHAENGDSQDADASQRSSSLDRPSLLPPRVPGVKERFILLDVEPTPTLGGNGPSSAPDALAGTSAGTGTTMMSTSPGQKQPSAQGTGTSFGYRIVSAHSLTSDWQVLDASFSPAPTFDTPQQQEQNTNDQGNALMLRIQGTAGFPRDLPGGKDGDAAEQTLEEMMEQFERRMGELRRVIEANGDYAAIPTVENEQMDDNHETGNDSPEQDGQDAGEGPETE
jgi:hypothetical protein